MENFHLPFIFIGICSYLFRTAVTTNGCVNLFEPTCSPVGTPIDTDFSRFGDLIERKTRFEVFVPTAVVLRACRRGLRLIFDLPKTLINHKYPNVSSFQNGVKYSRKSTRIPARFKRFKQKRSEIVI